MSNGTNTSRLRGRVRCARALQVAAGILLAGIFMAGCSATARQPSAGTAPIFYPPLPNEPRLQFLASYSSEQDLAPDSGSMRDFVLGPEARGGELLVKPYGVESWNGTVIVVDTRGPGWVVLDLTSKRARVVRPTGAGALSKPINMAIDTDGTRYVTDTGRDQVLVFDTKDDFVRAYGKSGQFKPVDVVVSRDELFVSDIAHHQVVVLDKRTGQEKRRFGKAGSAEGELFHPTNLALDAAGNLFVTDTTNFRVQKFAADGTFLRAYGQIGTAAGQFARPKGVAVDRAGRIFVVDAAFENVQILDPEGQPLLYFGSPGAQADSMNLPTTVTIDYDDVASFQQYAAPGFDIEYVVLVASQFGVNKVVAFGFGTYRGAEGGVGQTQQGKGGP